MCSRELLIDGPITRLLLSLSGLWNGSSDTFPRAPSTFTLTYDDDDAQALHAVSEPLFFFFFRTCQSRPCIPSSCPCTRPQPNSVIPAANTPPIRIHPVDHCHAMSLMCGCVYSARRRAPTCSGTWTGRCGCSCVVTSCKPCPTSCAATRRGQVRVCPRSNCSPSLRGGCTGAWCSLVRRFDCLSLSTG